MLCKYLCAFVLGAIVPLLSFLECFRQLLLKFTVV